MSKPSTPPAGSEAEQAGTLAPEPNLVAKRQEFFETFFKKGVQFTEELLAENERLRYQVLRLEGELGLTEAPTDPTVRKLADRIAELERERDTLARRFSTVEEQNRDFQERYAQIEREHNNLANLYVASDQLHSTLDLREVVQIIVEILINFVGAQTFAVYLLDDDAQTLHPLAAEGTPLETLPTVPLLTGILGQVVRTQEAYFANGVTSKSGLVMRNWSADTPMVATPLCVRGRAVGAIAIYRMLVQKTELAEIDFELFKLLTRHAAGALSAARLAAEVGPPKQVFSEYRDLLR